MNTLFTKIITGEIPAYKIVENERFLSFLDIRPITKGHTLVIPKKEEDEVFALDDETLAEMIIFAKKISQGIRKVIPCKKVGIMAIGLEIPHAHFHLVPINREEDLYFHPIKQTLMPEEMKTVAVAIASAYHELESKEAEDNFCQKNYL